MTESIISARRNRLLRLMSAEPDFKQVSPWQHIINSCEEYDRDVTLLILYSATEEATSCSLHLEACLGITQNHPAIPADLDMYDAKDGFAPIFRQAVAKKGSVLIEQSDGKLPYFLTNIEWRGRIDSATHVLVTPLFTTGLLSGFLIMGLNPKQPYDEGHRQFAGDFGRGAMALLESSISLDQIRAREEKLSEQLTAHEKFLAKVAEVVTVGIVRQTHDGHILWANSKFWEVSGMSNEPEDLWKMAGMEHIPPEERERAAQFYQEAISQQKTKTREIPLTRTWRPPGSLVDEPAWILLSLTADSNSVLGCLTDISHLKWSEKLQAKVAEDAKDAKRKQERFMDMTSHELRNPLSAILQCADDIATSCQSQDHQDAIAAILSCARTIIFCATHQKQIIDDILTVSKLDSSMLSISPIPIYAPDIVKQAIRMYESELALHDIAVHASVEESYLHMQINEVFCDPSRLTQILINLLT
jgi:PAS domain S-box-containing protein